MKLLVFMQLLAAIRYNAGAVQKPDSSIDAKSEQQQLNSHLKQDHITASDRAKQAMEGFMDYYWNQDSANKKISFFFSCGQIGGNGENWKKCSCSNDASCINCYRWWDAVGMETVATYGLYANTTNNSDVPEIIFEHSPYNGNWDGVNFFTFVDDFAWFGIAYLRVFDWLKDEKWLERSLAIYKWVWKFGWDDPCGGFWWSTYPGLHFKDSITIMEVLHFSSKLAYTFPKNSSYLKDAQKIWDWIFSFDSSRGLATETNLLSIGVSPERCCNYSSTSTAKKCVNSKLTGTSYNHGLFLSSSAYLYAVTEDPKYLKSGLNLLNAVLENYTTPEGVLKDELRSYQSYVSACSFSSDPGGDYFSFNGIFMLHLGYFMDVLEDNKALTSTQLISIQKFVQVTSDSAWNKSALWPPFNNTYDTCDTGISKSKTPTAPKFHWWWGKKQTQQIIPPDPMLFFKVSQLRCVGNKSQLWDGSVSNEDDCRDKCAQNQNCSKYLYSTDQYHCWTWSFNRSDHNCSHMDSSYNVGIRRPVGNGSCRGICGSSRPQKLEEGMCYCDLNCTHHLDCCLDYAEECIKEEYISCKGYCTKPMAQAIPGGGYCWCMDGCYKTFTDNNSTGSCCPDYPEECLNVKMPNCLDARSQGSAVNLFLAHMKSSSL